MPPVYIYVFEGNETWGYSDQPPTPGDLENVEADVLSVARITPVNGQMVCECIMADGTWEPMDVTKIGRNDLAGDTEHMRPDVWS